MDECEEFAQFNAKRHQNPPELVSDERNANLNRSYNINKRLDDDLMVTNDNTFIDNREPSIHFDKTPMNRWFTPSFEKRPELTVKVIGRQEQNEVQSSSLWSRKLRPPSPPLETDSMRGEAVIRLRIENFVDLDRQILSAPVYIRNMQWQILAMPKTYAGDVFYPPSYDRMHTELMASPKTVAEDVFHSLSCNRPRADMLGVFLQCSCDINAHWSVHAAAELRLLSFDGGKPYAMQIRHTFNAKSNDWGPTKFIAFDQILNSEYTHDGAVELEAKVVADVPTGVFWDSKLYTGYVGLENQGATCYMNSLLQTLFFTNELRRAIYQIPTEADDNKRSVALGLQRVFYDLQLSDRSVGTKMLTKSFGWNSVESLMQHDVQEFLRVLLDKLEASMRGTSLEGTIARLFGGQMKSYVKCINVDHCSMRSEMFYDIQLNIRGKNDVVESLKDYVAAELLNGDNRFDAGDLGMQVAEKGVIFISFPPVLHLHLMRFQYDPYVDACSKSNERFEFPEHLSLGEFLQSTDEGGLMEPEEAEYTLHTVLVHSGDTQTGHYIVYVNPKADGKWYKFDDNRVCAASKSDAIEYNYGGYNLHDDLYIRSTNSNAYMLVYILDSQIPTVLSEVLFSDIPDEVIAKLQYERHIEALGHIERNEEQQRMTVRIRLDDHLNADSVQSLFEVTKATDLVFHVRKSQTIAELVQCLSSAFKTPPWRLRLWPIRHPRGCMSLPSVFDHDQRASETITYAADYCNPWTVFLELAPVNDTLSLLASNDTDNKVQVFFKYYDPAAKRLDYCGFRFVPKPQTIIETLPTMCDMAGLPHGSELFVYREIKANCFYRLGPCVDSMLLQLVNYQNAAIVVFEKAAVYTADYELPTLADFSDDLMNRIDILFVDRLAPNDDGFTLSMSEKKCYHKMVEMLAHHLNVAVERLQFFRCEKYCTRNKDQQLVAVKSDFDGAVSDLIGISHYKNAPRLYYQRLGMDLKDLENRKHVIVNWLPINGKEEKQYSLFPLRCGTVNSILMEIKSQVQLDQVNGSGSLRLVDVTGGRLAFGPCLDLPLDNIEEIDVSIPNMNPNHYRVEEIPNDEIILLIDEMLVPLLHYNKDSGCFFGHPFFVKVKEGELWINIKRRVHQKAGMTNEDCDQLKLLMIRGTNMEYLPDDSETVMHLSSFQWDQNDDAAVQPCLGLEHMFKQYSQQKRCRSGTVSSNSVIIYN